MRDRLDERIESLLARIMSLVPDSPDYPAQTARRPENAGRRARGWVVASSAAVMVLASIGIPVLLNSPFQKERPTTVGGPAPSTTELDSRPPIDVARVMEVRPTTNSPGGTVELSFLEAGARGVGYRLEARLDDGLWQPIAWLIAAAGGYSGVAESGTWTENVIFPQVLVSGSDPDIVVLPDGLVPGRYRMCDASGWLSCADFEVVDVPIGTETPECVRLGPQPPGEGETLIYVLCDSNSDLPYPVVRSLTAGLDSTTSAILSLVRGTTVAERQTGLSVGFDSVPMSERQRIQVRADIDDSGVLSIEFLLDGEHWNPGSLASTTSQLLSFSDPVVATAFEFPNIAAINLSGMCWGESQCGAVLDRKVWEQMVTNNSGRNVGVGCGLIGAWLDPSCGAQLAPAK